MKKVELNDMQIDLLKVAINSLIDDINERWDEDFERNEDEYERGTISAAEYHQQHNANINWYGGRIDELRAAYLAIAGGETKHGKR